MTAADADLIAERATDAADQTPTLTEAIGCMDCELIFRCGAVCPYCASAALLNVAGAINEHRAVDRMNGTKED